MPLGMQSLFRRPALLGVAVATSVLVLSGCSPENSDGSPVEGVGATRTPSNPVDVLRQIPDCELDPGATSGDVDMNGNRYASCSFLDNAGTTGTVITVRTYGADPMVVAPEDTMNDDSHKKIYGDDWLLTITGDFGSYAKHIDPQAIADAVGGEVVPD